jgi:hypothetical protein
MRLIILKFLYFVLVMWQLMWTTYILRELVDNHLHIKYLLYIYVNSHLDYNSRK